MLLRISLLVATLVTPVAGHAMAGAPGHLSTGSLDTTTPRLSWTLDPPTTTRAKVMLLERGIEQTAYEIRVATAPSLLAGAADLWNSGAIQSSAMQATYAGKDLPSGTRIYWKVRAWERSLAHATATPSAWSAPASFITGLKGWTADWIAATPDSPAGETTGVPNDRRLPLFRRSIQVPTRPVKALLFVSGLGQDEVRLNGHAITRDVLTPGWTNYRQRVLYDTYDVRAMIDAGEDVFGVLLGNGMYNALEVHGRYSKFSNTYGQPKLIAELHLTFADGAEQVVRTGKDWLTAPGPLTFSNTYGGEDFDARLEQAGWDKPGFDDAAWKSATVVASPGGTLRAEQTPPVRVVATYKAIAVTHPRPGITVYDLGQNFAGWPAVEASGPAGASIRLLPGELLDAKGLVTQHSANAGPADPADFHYVLAGTGTPERWHPRFSYYGFRYVQVESSNPAVRIVSLTGEAIHADATEVGHFTSSNDLLNRTHTLILNALRSNMVSILTDCPHREKLGWLEQTHLFATSLMVNYDVSALYRKTSDDMAEAQLPDGLIPSIAPEVTQFLDSKGRSNDFRDSPEWGSAVILSPWAAFQSYGDPGPLREHYVSMQRYLQYLQAKAKGNLLDYGLGDWYDIGPGEPGYAKLSSKTVTATGTLYEDLTAMRGIALALGKKDDAALYQQQAESVRDAYNAALFHPLTGQYDRGSQTANAMPLALGIAPDAARPAVLANLIHDIEAHQYHVTAGDVGFHYVVRALTDAGRSDVLARMLAVTTSPSYGYQLARGATTLTEAWDTNPNSSQNHFMLGHAEEWFYRGLAGIDLDLSRPAAEQIRIRPYIPQDASDPTHEAAASIETPLGTIASSWSHTASGMKIDITIPPNSTGTVTFPSWSTSPVGSKGWRESGRPVEKSLGVLRVSDDTVRLTSGTYRFEAAL